MPTHGVSARGRGYIVFVGEYAMYPGGDRFESWQDHEWPEHCSVPAAYVGEIGLRELDAMSGGDVETFLREHDVDQSSEARITLDMVPPHAAPVGEEAWASTIHHFRCTGCGWDLLLWDAN